LLHQAIYGYRAVFWLSDKSFELPVVGVFEISDGKINAWRNYFDMSQFSSHME
jgi:limonene-1,2-epoxide hydrolase